MAMGFSRLLLRRFSPTLIKKRSSSSSSSCVFRPLSILLESSTPLNPSANKTLHCRNLCSRSSSSSPHLHDSTDQAPAPINYHALLQEDEFHKLANNTIYHLQEKLEEYGDNVQIDGFDIEYGNEVLTIKLGVLGTYVLNKQTPNRQIWLSSPVSGPSRFDWDPNTQAWIYRRSKQNLVEVLETELEQLCGEAIELS